MLLHGVGTLLHLPLSSPVKWRCQAAVKPSSLGEVKALWSRWVRGAIKTLLAVPHHL